MQIPRKPPGTTKQVPWASAETEIQKTLAALKKMKDSGVFEPFIDFVQFPKFRNLRPGTRVTFDFPLTVLVGRNGTGKTAVLLALRGSPGGTSVGNWWFGTEVDPIDADADADPSVAKARRTLDSEKRSAFWYSYRSNGAVRQVLKTRILRVADPDYWEPSRPIQKYGMSLIDGKERHPTIEMNVLYLNFRMQVSAFDRCFYYHSKQSLSALAQTKRWEKLVGQKPRQPRVQDFLRHRSRALKNALAGVGQTRQAQQRVRTRANLSAEELTHIARILGREYSSGTLIEHRFYETWGTSVQFSTEHRSYTDAYAGSGEAAVVTLVREVCAAAPGTLVLLDEPEISLHPGAQRELVRFLLNQCRDKKLQVVLSTHSPTIVQSLPAAAIRVCVAAPDGFVDVDAGRSAAEAFYEIGAVAPNSTTILVEDALAAEIIESVAQSMPAVAANLVVRFTPGGASTMFNDIAVYAGGPLSPWFVFDGDQAPKVEAPDWRSFPNSELSPKALDDSIKNHIGMAVKFHEDSNALDAVKIKQRQDYLDYLRKRVRFLPFGSPEDAIWDDIACRDTLKSFRPDEPEVDLTAGKEDAKKRFQLLARHLEVEVGVVHRLFLTRFSAQKGVVWSKIQQLLKEIVQGNDA